MITIWKYEWGSWGAEISNHPRMNKYRWSVYDINGDGTYDFYSDIDSDLQTPEEAEDNMFREINSRIGHEPERQIKAR